MTEEDNKKLKEYLTSEMVSRVTLAEAINIMHNLAVQEVEANVGKMSDEEKKEALEELSSRVKAKQKQKTQEETAE
jgi:PIN domain nuclease of toxin-antitoxin system|tara:strand:- start:178 stop:405 length:228 start_codon:yes stop_codon:yes gene_type:complete